MSWEFERQSGYNGYRCKQCGHWIYSGAPFECVCNSDKATYDVIITGFNTEQDARKFVQMIDRADLYGSEQVESKIDLSIQKRTIL